MGRIEDALQKLQARAQRAAPAVPTEIPIASLVPKERAYSGHRIAVDSEQLRVNGLLVPDSEQRRLAEQYRAIKRPLLRNADRSADPLVPRGNVIMVASAVAGEGKTFTCVNLSLSIARERDWNVVLVDADCSKPHLTKMFAAENQLGLIDLLRDSSLAFDSLVMPTDVPGLSLLPAGSRDVHASELLASRRMDELCTELSEEGTNRIVLFDSSPLLLTTEATVLASKVGQIVVIVCANKTPQDAVKAALEKLDQTKAIGCVLNQSWGSGDFGDGYGYGYGADGPGGAAKP